MKYDAAAMPRYIADETVHVKLGLNLLKIITLVHTLQLVTAVLHFVELRKLTINYGINRKFF